MLRKIIELIKIISIKLCMPLEVGEVNLKTTFRLKIGHKKVKIFVNPKKFKHYINS